MNITLVIVDMQLGFEGRYKSAQDFDLHVKSVSNSIKTAIKKNYNILFVEYDGFGKTNKDLLDIVKKSGRKIHKVKKKGDDGSWEVQLYMEKRKWENPIVCGAFTYACVKETVIGLAQMGMKPKLISSSCYPSIFDYVNFQLKKNKVKIVKYAR